ncbi:MAG: hypothetical protein CTY16_15775 [Methylobacter sp.]|nr:MAG: hypothetical protein CTY16_15775 [Methylobacter sp.]
MALETIPATIPTDLLQKAEMLINPTVRAAMTMTIWKGNPEVSAYDIAQALIPQIEAVNNGDRERTEAMLVAQAYTLDELFNQLARQARNRKSLKQFELDLRLALKAQSQCRATLETLAAIKNPPVIYAKQANISNGHQQINNGTPATHTGNCKIPPNELLEAQHGSTTVDTGTTGAASGENPAMAAVE